MDHFVGDLAIVLGVAAVTNLIFRKLGQSSVLGYLFAGLLVGPYIPIPIFADSARISALSEFGVVLVMFAVGLEFSVRRLIRVLPIAGFTGMVQIFVLGAAGFAFARAVGMSTMEGVFLGGCVSISSTMVVAKVFAERPPSPRVRELVFGVLVVQDLAAILIVAALTTVAAGAALSPEVLGTTLRDLAIALIAMVLGGLLVVPRFVRFMVKLESAESLLLGSVALCFGLASLAEHLGYSVALGAFLAGTLVAESGRAHDVEQLVHPIRDLFAAVFFVSVGMSVDPRVALEHGWLAIGVAAIVIGGQFLAISTAGVLSGNGVRRSVTAALALGQVGEFAFIISAIGTSAGVIGEFLRPVVVSVAVLTAFTTPMLIRVSPRVAAAVDKALPRALQTFATLCESWFETLRNAPPAPRARSHLRNSLLVIAVDSVAIALVWGIATMWRSEIGIWVSARVGLPTEWQSLVAAAGGGLVTLPLVIALLRSVRRAGQLLAERVIPKRAEGLDPGLAPRRAFVATLQSMFVFLLGIPILLSVSSLVGLPAGLLGLVVITAVLGVYFWRSALNLQGHVRAGAAALAELLERQLADDEPPSATLSLPSAEALLPGLGHVDAFVVRAGTRALGHSLAELDLRAATGASVVAISRGDTGISMPTGHHRLEEGDTVVLAGAQHAVEAARGLLNESAST